MTARIGTKVLRVAIKVVKAAIKAVVALGKGLMALGGPAAAVIIIVLVVVLVFIAGLDPFPNKEMNAHEALKEVNMRAQARLSSIVDEIPYDEINISGQRANWREMLASYFTYYDYWDEYQAGKLEAVGLFGRQPRDIDDILDEVYLDWHSSSLLNSGKLEQQKLLGFSYELETYKEKGEQKSVLSLAVQPFDLDGYESWIGVPSMQERFRMYLSDEYEEAYRELIYGTNEPSIADVAEVEFGAPGGEKFWKDYYEQSSRWEWCAIFVSYCIHNSVLDEKVSKNYGGVMDWYSYFLDNRRFAVVDKDNNPKPQPGWIIFYNWWEEKDGELVRDAKMDHIGVVTEVRNNLGKTEVVTIEGNVRDSCMMLIKDWNELYSLGVVGYGYFWTEPKAD